ncbi:MAG: DUF4982 domain-containing protein [Bacteroidaceae bacterium]|nr:DUF4982 domain-containing protein [Bacteroidaceae bacterium]
MKRVLSLIIFGFFLFAHTSAQRAINWNEDWQMLGKTVTLPRAWNEEYAFKVRCANLPDDTVRYTKTFTAPKAWKNKKVFIEFEGARQAAEVWLNGYRLGLHENGVMAFGFDLTPYLKIGKENRLEVLTDNDWGYKERGASTEGEGVTDGNSLPNNTLEPASFQWNNKNFNANYGGLPKNVRLHVVDKLYQTLPLYSTLGTTGVYVYATAHDVQGHSATIHAESQVRNETGKAQTFVYEVEIIDRDGTSLAKFSSPAVTIGKDETKTVSAQQHVQGLHFWSWGYGYLYDVKTRLLSVAHSSQLLDEAITTTGFRKTAFEHGQTILNDRPIMMHGYAQRTSNEWPGVGMSVPAWLSDYSNGLMVESGGNLVRWMHVCPWKQDVESCDRVGLIQAMPAGDAEKDVTGRHWEQRVELMRDAIIYNRNNPSILFYECGNKGITESHMREMKAIRDEFDPHGGRAIGCREMLSNKTVAEYGGEMLYINKSATKPVWAMEYCRDEALRRYWDDWSYPYHKHGDGPLYRGDDASAYNQNNDQFAVEMVRRWFDYWRERPGTGERVSGGGAKIIFSDTNTHNRGESNYRTSGVVDAMRLPKDAFYAHQVMWNGWVTPEVSQTHLVGHWNYATGVRKPVYVVSDAPCVRLFLNGNEVGKDSVAYHFLHVFADIPFQAGVLRAVSFNEQGEELSSDILETAGDPVALKITNVQDHQLVGDGADMALLQVEAVDAEGRRNPLAHQQLCFSIGGPIEWIGGIGKDADGTNCVRSLSLPLECGVNRVLVRSSGGEGEAVVKVSAKGLGETSIVLSVKGVVQPSPKGILVRGETPATPSYRDVKKSVHVKNVVAGCNQETAHYSVDDSEDTEWKNDGRAATAWIRYELEEPARVDEVVLKLTGWRKREYPLQIFADSTLVWEGKTPVSLGYVHLPLRSVDGTPLSQMLARSVTIRLRGAASDSDQYGHVKELTEPVANELDLFKAKDGEKVHSELRIVEVEFLQYL